MERIFKISIYTLILFGTIQSLSTFLLFTAINSDSIIFFGTGLLYIFMGLYNLSAWKIKVKSIAIVAAILNFIGIIIIITIIYIFRDLQAFLALILVIIILLGSIRIIK
jgi:hypothetical protein